MLVSAILDGKGHHVESVAPSDKVSSVVKLLAERKIGVVLVMTKQQIDGIFSERDIVRVIAERGAAALDEDVGAVMTRQGRDLFAVRHGGLDHGAHDQWQIQASAGARQWPGGRPDLDR